MSISNYSFLSLLLLLLIIYKVNTLKPNHVEDQAKVEFVKPSVSLEKNKGFFIKKPDFLMVSLSAFDSHFVLLLFPIHQVAVKSYNDSGVTHSNYTSYLGRLEHQPNSKAYGYIYHGVFVGTFFTPEEMYHVEPYGDKSNKSVLINKQSNFVKKPLQASSHEKDEKVKMSLRGDSSYKNKVCNVRMNVDHTYARSQRYDEERIIGTLHMLIMMSNDIFVSQDFDNDGQIDKLGLRLSEVRLFYNKTNYRFGEERLLAREILYQASLDTDDSSCLDIWVINRDLRKSGYEIIKGLSFNGSPRENAGVCSRKMRNREEVEVKRNKVFVNVPVGKDLSSLDLVLSFVHELGHAFGASHTFSGQCQQNEKGGHYIMVSPLVKFTTQTFTFSECSRRKIYETINVKSHCLIKPPAPICGDGIVDDNEECDCGLTKYCRFVDDCCYTKLSTVGEACKRKPNCFLQEYCAIKSRLLSYHDLVNPICKTEYNYFVKANG